MSLSYYMKIYRPLTWVTEKSSKLDKEGQQKKQSKKRKSQRVMYNIVKSIEIEQRETSVCTSEVRLTMTNDIVHRPQIFLLSHMCVFARLYLAIYASLQASGPANNFIDLFWILDIFFGCCFAHFSIKRISI